MLLTVRLNLRFSLDASIADVERATVSTWQERYWEYELPEDWNAKHQWLEADTSWTMTSYRDDASMSSIGPYSAQLYLTDGTVVREQLWLTPPGSEARSALFLRTPQYDGDIGLAHVSSLAVAEVSALSIRDDVVEVEYSVGDPRVMSARVVLVNRDLEFIDGSPRLMVGENLYTDGRGTRYEFRALSEAERARVHGAYVILYDGPDNQGVYHYRSYSNVVTVEGSSE
jgi:hypothetical protein